MMRQATVIATPVVTAVVVHDDSRSVTSGASTMGPTELNRKLISFSAAFTELFGELAASHRLQYSKSSR
jgi:hypothetical protein